MSPKGTREPGWMQGDDPLPYRKKWLDDHAGVEHDPPTWLLVVGLFLAVCAVLWLSAKYGVL